MPPISTAADVSCGHCQPARTANPPSVEVLALQRRHVASSLWPKAGRMCRLSKSSYLALVVSRGSLRRSSHRVAYASRGSLPALGSTQAPRLRSACCSRARRRRPIWWRRCSGRCARCRQGSTALASVQRRDASQPNVDLPISVTIAQSNYGFRSSHWLSKGGRCELATYQMCSPTSTFASGRRDSNPRPSPW